jgi:hypothetical protein
VELEAIQDARTQSGSPDQNFPNGILWTNTVGHQSFVQFDLTALPPNARIDSAVLKLYFNGNYALGPNDVQVGEVQGPWEEGTLTWNNQPAIDWNGTTQTVSDTEGDVSWDVTRIVSGWQRGTNDNYGFGLRSEEPGGKQYWSKEHATKPGPRLVLTYTIPAMPAGPYEEAGDAPDSTNHHGQVNTAYVIGAVPGNFPTVWQVPAGQPAGPRHDNITLQGFLGNFITRELDADVGPDQDGVNNILRMAAGAIVDDADNDFGDDGLRSRNFRYYNCLKHTMKVRVTRPFGATLPQMFLNAWSDWNRDGDWADTAPCVPPSGGPAQPGYEWIVQNRPINMLAIPPGTSVDLLVPTERVMNVTEGLPHWMRFTLGEAPAVAPLIGLPDGRGPHPLSAAKSFRFGETEDLLQLPPPPGELGDLVLEKSVLDANGVVPQGGIVTYQIRLKNQGGTGPAPAHIEDQLPAPLHPLPLVASAVTVTSSTGGVSPLEASIGLAAGPSGAPEFRVFWDGEMSPDTEVTLSFKVHVHPTCNPFQGQKEIVNLAEASAPGEPDVSASASFLADCPGAIVVQEAPINPSDWLQLP